MLFPQYDCHPQRIQEPRRAQEFINAVLYKQDHLFEQLANHLDSIASIYAYDVMVHKNCVRNYIRDYQRRLESAIERLENEENEAAQPTNVLEVFETVLASLGNYKNSFSYVIFLR